MANSFEIQIFKITVHNKLIFAPLWWYQTIHPWLTLLAVQAVC